jgi:hypothetical protein
MLLLSGVQSTLDDDLIIGKASDGCKPAAGAGFSRELANEIGIA